jgi:hypothetical protein
MLKRFRLMTSCPQPGRMGMDLRENRLGNFRIRAFAFQVSAAGGQRRGERALPFAVSHAAWVRGPSGGFTFVLPVLIVTGQARGFEIGGLFAVVRGAGSVDGFGRTHRVQCVRGERLFLLDDFRDVVREPAFGIVSRFASLLAPLGGLGGQMRKFPFDPLVADNVRRAAIYAQFGRLLLAKMALYG